MFSASPFIHAPVRLLPNWRTQYFGNELTDFHTNWHKWSAGQLHESVNFGGLEVKGQRSRSQEAEIRFGVLVEVSFCQVVFLVLK